MNYEEMLDRARDKVNSKCRVCKVCNGMACRGEIPGVGGKGSGESFVRNYEKLQEIKLNMDTLYAPGEIDTSLRLFGIEMDTPICAGPIGGLDVNYGCSEYSYFEFSRTILKGCKESGAIAFTADGVEDEMYEGTLRAIKEVDHYGIPTMKPWKLEEVRHKLALAEKANVPAIAMDVDSAGLIVLNLQGKPVKPKGLVELRNIIESTNLPFIVKGIMTIKGAMIAKDAGAAGIIVSNHGGRVLDQTPATIEVLPEIADVVGGEMTILIDGGIRSGLDIFKCLALGADAVMIGRPYAISVFGGGVEGVKLYTNKLTAELKDAMLMTGCTNLSDVTADKVRFHRL